MGATTSKGFPYPVSTDSVDVPSDIYRLANAIETAVTTTAIASTIPYRETGGAVTVGTPTTTGHAATKSYVDTALTTAIPLTTTGDIIYSSSGSTAARLGIGANGYVLTVSGGVPVWAASSGGGGGGSGTGTGYTQTSGSISANTATTIDSISVFSGLVSTTGTIGTVSGTGPYTATITGMSSTTNMVSGQTITATNGTGGFGTGTMTIVTVVSGTSITVSSTATFTAGTVTNITVNGPIGIEYLLNMRQGTKSRVSTVRIATDGAATPTISSSEYGVVETGASMTGVNVTAVQSTVYSQLQVTVTDASTTPVTWRLSRIAQ